MFMLATTVTILRRIRAALQHHGQAHPHTAPHSRHVYVTDQYLGEPTRMEPRQRSKKNSYSPCFDKKKSKSTVITATHLGA